MNILYFSLVLSLFLIFCIEKEVFDKVKLFIWGKLIPTDWLCKFRKLTPINHFGRFIRRLVLPKRFCPYYDFFNFMIDAEMAEWIRYNSVERPHTNRAIAKAFKERYPHTDVEGEDGYDGQNLKYFCEDYLKISLEELCENSKEYHESIEAMAQAFKDVFKKFNIGKDNSEEVKDE